MRNWLKILAIVLFLIVLTVLIVRANRAPRNYIYIEMTKKNQKCLKSCIDY